MPAPANNIRTIAISTGGGDCPGLNAVIRAAVKSAILQYGWNVLGIQDGFDGLIWPEKCRKLELKDVSGILPRGGTILGTTNRGDPFKYKVMVDVREVVQDLSEQIIGNAHRLGIDAILVIGGDGTQKIELDLFQRGVNVVGVPKTIDNDLSATEVTFGFDTALHTATDAIDKIHTTAESHHRTMVAEGIKLPTDLREVYGQERRASPRSGTVGNVIGDALGMRLKREVRVTVLGHIQRGGSPSPFDRILSTRFGVAAVDLIARGEFGKMVCLRQARIQSVDIAEAVGKLKTVDPNGDMVHTARATGLSFGE